jgi:hypothetical protein
MRPGCAERNQRPKVQGWVAEIFSWPKSATSSRHNQQTQALRIDDALCL